MIEAGACALDASKTLRLLTVVAFVTPFVGAALAVAIGVAFALVVILASGVALAFAGRRVHRILDASLPSGGRTT
jgi:hypothetical protein